MSTTTNWINGVTYLERSSMRKQNTSRKRYLFILILLLIISAVFSSSIGSANLTGSDSLKIILSRIPLLNGMVDISGLKEVYIKIVWEIRLPRIILAGFTGCGLSVVGATFQGLFRNPLADPHILGVSSGAAMGATVAMLSGIGLNFLGFGVIGIFAFIGALIAVFLVYQIACVGNKLPVVNILLTGTAISTMLSALISLLMTFNQEQIDKVYLWTLGSFSASTWPKVSYLTIFVVTCTSIILLFSRELDVMTTGNETAESLGINTTKVKKILIVTASLLVAACVSVSGIIGFVGLVIPHCIRLISGPKHQWLLPLSCLGGAIFMILCDTLARTIAPPSEIPVGVITALLGTPYFIALLQNHKRKLVSQ